ncbi:hypothetical protein RQP50_04000 [Paenibacillus sp. chi10]|uniref:Uncharacterized protein n=1 Tax=Paenibacillus suaedae TaxID=3077233 RepID=A0AAJ2N325_9BACL|nr:hypothetical protein [Paenibacillus sp. chi10]MDT8975405.1 hypothetical protein [Paenibacillus sp. chi10]
MAKLSVKQQLLASFIVFVVSNVVAIATPWNQYKMLFMTPVIVFSAFVGILISKKILKNDDKS